MPREALVLVGMIGRSVRIATVLALSLSLLLLWPSSPVALEAAELRQPALENMSVGETELGVGAAFDGTNLWYTLGWNPPDAPDTTIYRIDLETETVVAALDMFELTEGRNIVPGGLAWDPNLGHLWVATMFDLDAASEESEGDGEIFEVDPAEGALVSSFPTRPITEEDEFFTGVIDGLAFDSGTGTLWFSTLGAFNVYQVTVEGELLSSFALPFGPEFWNAGLTFDGNHLWLSLRMGMPKEDLGAGLILAEFTTAGTALGIYLGETGPQLAEDLAFDGVTFAPQCVVWANSIDSTLTAFEVPCSLRVEETMHPGDTLDLEKQVSLPDVIPFAEGGPTDVSWEVECEAPGIDVTLQPEMILEVEFGTTVLFDESIAVPMGTPPGEYHCVVAFLSSVPEGGAVFEQQMIWITVEAPPQDALAVPLDIKPRSCRNPLNVKSKGVLPVAILGTEDFDVSQIDPTTVTLEGVAPLRWSTEDVATPFEPYLGKEEAYDCTEDGPDGFDDLTLKFKTRQIVAALGEVSHGDVLVLKISGNLWDGTAFEGEDVVVILKKVKGWRHHSDITS